MNRPNVFWLATLLPLSLVALSQGPTSMALLRVVLLGCLVAATGCGAGRAIPLETGSNPNPPSNPVTPAGTYTIVASASERRPDANRQSYVDRSVGLDSAVAIQGSNGPPGAGSGGPGPLEVVSTQPSGYVHHFADEVESGYLAALHRLCVEFCGVDASGGYLGLGVALGSGGCYLPGMAVAAPWPLERRWSNLPARWIATHRSAIRAGSTARIASTAAAASRRALRASKGASHFDAWCKVKRDGLAGPPVGGHLQDRGTTQVRDALPASFPGSCRVAAALRQSRLPRLRLPRGRTIVRDLRR